MGISSVIWIDKKVNYLEIVIKISDKIIRWLMRKNSFGERKKEWDSGVGGGGF